MSPISSESIFHFTPSLEKVIGILKNGFYPNLCHERIELNAEVLKAHFPMVCFCDIPLSQIIKHTERYGQYGLGLSKEWGRSKGLNPVLYIRKGSTLSAHVQGLKPILLEGGIAETGFSDQQKTVLDILRYIKSFEGTSLRGGERRKKNQSSSMMNERLDMFHPQNQWGFIY